MTQLAKRLDTTKQDAVRTAVQSEVNRLVPKPSLRERLEAFYREFPLPESTGLKAACTSLAVGLFYKGE